MSNAQRDLNPDSNPATRTKTFAVSLGNTAEINGAPTARTNPAQIRRPEPAEEDEDQGKDIESGTVRTATGFTDRAGVKGGPSSVSNNEKLRIRTAFTSSLRH